MWTRSGRRSTRQLEGLCFLKHCCCSPGVLELGRETLGEMPAAMVCGDGGWSPPAPEQPGVWGDFRRAGRGRQRREAAQDYPRLPHGAAAAPTQSLKTALSQPGWPGSGSGEREASGRIAVQGLGKGFPLGSSDPPPRPSQGEAPGRVPGY